MEKMKVRIEIWFWLAIIGKGNKQYRYPLRVIAFGSRVVIIYNIGYISPVFNLKLDDKGS